MDYKEGAKVALGLLVAANVGVKDAGREERVRRAHGMRLARRRRGPRPHPHGPDAHEHLPDQAQRARHVHAPGHDHTHTDQTRTSTFQTKRNARATCTHPANESLTRATKVRADDVLPYAVHEIANIQNDIKTHALDHSHIILAESDSDTVGHVLKEENMLK